MTVAFFLSPQSPSLPSKELQNTKCRAIEFQWYRWGLYYRISTSAVLDYVRMVPMLQELRELPRWALTVDGINGILQLSPSFVSLWSSCCIYFLASTLNFWSCFHFISILYFEQTASFLYMHTLLVWCEIIRVQDKQTSCIKLVLEIRGVFHSRLLLLQILITKTRGLLIPRFQLEFLCSQHVSQCKADDGDETDKKEGKAHLNFPNTALHPHQCLEREKHDETI